MIKSTVKEIIIYLNLKLILISIVLLDDYLL